MRNKEKATIKACVENVPKIFLFVKSLDAGYRKTCITLNALNTLQNKFRIFFFSFEKSIYDYDNNLQAHFINKRSAKTETFEASKIFLFIKDLQKTIALLRKNKPCMLFAYGIYPFILLSISKIIYKVVFRKSIPLIVMFDINLYQAIAHKPGKLYQQMLFISIKLLLKHINFIWVETTKRCLQDTLKNFQLKINKRTYVIPNGTKVKNKAPLTISKKESAKIISVGRLEYPKDYETIIRAFEKVFQYYPTTKLTIIGEGPLKRKLQKLTAKLNLENKVFFLGWRKDIFKYLRKSHVFVFSSLWEGFGYVIIEAMSEGLPIVATDTPYGPREILDNGKYGLLVPMRNEKKMSQAILSLLKNQKLYNYYSKKSLERAAFFSETKMLKAYQRLFNRIMIK